MIEALFVFTLAMMIPAAFKFVGLLFGISIDLPPVIISILTPDHYIIFYPSLMFQIWFWTNKLGVFL